MDEDPTEDAADPMLADWDERFRQYMEAVPVERLLEAELAEEAS